MKLSLKLIFTTILVTLIAATSYADSYTLEGVVYDLVEDGTAEIVGYTDELPGRLTVPEQISVDDDVYTVTAVRDSAFLNSNLWWIDLPATIRSIGSAAFQHPNGMRILDLMTLRSPEPPEIGDRVFFPNDYDEYSAQIYVDDRVYGKYTADPGWTKKSLHCGYAYEIDSLYYRILDREARTAEVIQIPQSEHLSYFLGYNTVPERLPDSVTIEGEDYLLTSIGKCAFRFANLNHIKIQSTISNIGALAFYRSGLMSIGFEHNADTPLTLGGTCFGSSSIHEVEFPEGVTIIESGIFEQCHYLENVILPSTISFVGDGAFIDTFSLQTVTVKATTPPEVGDFFHDLGLLSYIDYTLYVPKGCVEAYSEAEGWRDFPKIAEIESAIDGVEADVVGRLSISGKVYSAAGSVLRSVSDPQGVTAAVCCEGLPAGVYVVRLTDTTGRTTAVRTAVR